jgi:hypothetical protein
VKLINPGSSRKGWHRLQNALRCPRLHALSVKYRDSTPLSPALIRGTLVHVGLAHYYAKIQAKQKGIKNEYYPAHDSVEVLAMQQTSQRDEWCALVSEVQRVLAAYGLHWESEQWEVVDIEKEIQANVFDDDWNETYLYTQRVDLIVRHPKTRKIFFIDHKTTYRIGKKTTGRYTLSGQFLGYQLLGSGLLKENWGGVMLNLIEWPKTPDTIPQFQRLDIERAPFAVSNFKKTIIQAERIIRANQGHTDPMAWPGAYHEYTCWTAYGPCSYHDLCQWGEP